MVGCGPVVAATARGGIIVDGLERVEPTLKQARQRPHVLGAARVLHWCAAAEKLSSSQTEPGQD